MWSNQTEPSDLPEYVVRFFMTPQKVGQRCLESCLVMNRAHTFGRYNASMPTYLSCPA